MSAKSLTVVDLLEMKQRGEKITCLTAYDASFARLLDANGIDALLVGDSLGMVLQGHNSTIPVTIAQMQYHLECVSRAVRRAFVIADLPFLSYTDTKTALVNSAVLMQSGAQMVKLEGAHCQTIQELRKFGIPVCGHLGLQPQSINQLGGYKVQGLDAHTAKQIAQQAVQIEQSGASLLVLECVPQDLATRIASAAKIPVIGIGAGVGCDGQVLVLHDMLGISDKTPRFCKNFVADTASIPLAIARFHQQVKEGSFP